ncbi:hypothetical protein [Planctomicrobium piriforme]|nr:hypothetical protein [Planctomicrobium piriforme]
MSAEIRNLLQSNPAQSSREIFEALQTQFPGQEINRNSCNVAFSHARRKLGIRGGSKRVVVRRAKPGVKVSGGSVGGLNFDVLKAARELLTQAGSAEAATQAIHQLQSLQIN